MQDEVLFESLQEFIDLGYITEILGVISSGKEASVAACCADPVIAGCDLVAAKIYRPLTHRNFRNNAIYQAGRIIPKSRIRRAMEKNTQVGQKFHFILWVNAEWDTLRALHAAGADVPRPITRSRDTILMQYLGDGEYAAPRLQEFEPDAELAAALLRRLMDNVELLLRHNVVHGDLSPYNILYWADRPWVIDLPQAIDPRQNPHAYALLCRDVENVVQYCNRFGTTADPRRIADDLWRRFLRAEW